MALQCSAIKFPVPVPEPRFCRAILVARSTIRRKTLNLQTLGTRSPWKSTKFCRALRCEALKEGGEAIDTSSKVERSAEKVSAVLFDMDGVLCNSEDASRRAGVELFAEMGVPVTTEDFFPFMGTGETNFLGGVARVKGVEGFDPVAAKKRFFEIYLQKYAKPNSGIGYEGSLDLVLQCKSAGLKVAVASSADRIKVNANLAAAGIPVSSFDAVVSADAFENLKPAPDIFLAASKALDVPPNECVVVEDALAGIEAANAAKMRCIAVTTTLSEEKLIKAGPCLVRKDIGNISISDIRNCKNAGTANMTDEGASLIEVQNNGSNKALQESVNVEELPSTESFLDLKFSLPGGMQVSRRDVMRVSSLGVAISCSLYAITHWKAMSYVSPKSLLNALLGVGKSSIINESGMPQSERIVQLRNYIEDLETRETGRQVPEFPSRLDWLNSTPLGFRRDLNGKIVLLDFWTYCCINCMHVLPDLKYLEKKFKGKPFTVVGVHSAKFDNEKDLDAIRNAVLRYEITHPVVNDGEMTLWRELGINSWPTFVLVSPTGKVIAQLSGEGRRQDLDDLVAAALQYYGEKQLLNDTPIPEFLEKQKDNRLLSSPLKFPGKLAVDISNNRLFISDSNNHRIVITDLEGNFIMNIGSGEETLRDGTVNSAGFNRPQGLAYNPKKNLLYVADTENHALREVNFVSETVRTLAGNGEKGSDYKGGRVGGDQVLNSPWDVSFDDASQIIFIAMAGQHQIWQHSTESGITKVFSGDGYERNLNGKSSTSTSFAQPSGLSLSPDMEELYVADSESSSIRSVNLKTGGSRLLAGGDPLFAENLFQFGDRDGSGTEAQFQHPLGVCCGFDGMIYIADSYNHKIKVMDPISKKVTTLAGTGKAGFKDGTSQLAQLSEPAGICDGGNGRLFVADTNNNVVRFIDLRSNKGPMVNTLELKGVQVPTQNKSPKRLRRRIPSDATTIKVDPVSATQGALNLQFQLSVQYHFSKEAQSKFETDVTPADALTISPMDGNLDSKGSAVIHFNTSDKTSAAVRINCKVYYCKEDEVCLYKNLVFEVPFSPTPETSSQEAVPLSYTIQPKK